eukprot:TRINITY_DN10731_c0_g1_i7.p1 TRINITY_DN10731_c0_g1~~TRINITY_DN10731_c0_g1_i7.p1  ORF type:complete len:348 (-),score=74.36 TRINITY_DN10731_c0_g1_i7:109-1152(-)
MTLKTFHFAGVASMNVTMGVPRIKEIINAAKTISTPIITAHLYAEKDDISARLVKGKIEKTYLRDVARYIKEVFSPLGCFLVIKLDQEVIEKLRLELTIEDVKRAITQTGNKLKLKEAHVHIVNRMKIRVEPYDYAPEKMFFILQELKRKLPDVVLKGLPRVSRGVINRMEKKDGLELLIEGYGLKEVLNTPGINPYQTSSNHIMEAFDVLGIEAARRTIIEQIKYTMSSHGITVDTRHIEVVADVMTYKGRILGITRFGLGKMKDSTLMLASFEKTTDILFDAAIVSKQDSVVGVSESIILGNQMDVGTGMFKVLQNTRKESERLSRYNRLLTINPVFNKVTSADI